MSERGRVLVVEDDPALSGLLERGLGRRGFDVRVVASPDEAMAVLRETELDALLTDLRLGNADGLELTQEALRVQPDLPEPAVPRAEAGYSSWLTSLMRWSMRPMNPLRRSSTASATPALLGVYSKSTLADSPPALRAVIVTSTGSMVSLMAPPHPEWR